MPTPALLLTIATLLPLASFVILVFFGKRIGNPLAGYFGTAMIFGSFVCSVVAMLLWLQAGAAENATWGASVKPINLPMKWIPIGTPESPNGVEQQNRGYLDIGVYVDSLTVVMFAMVTLVATLVHLFSIGYMREDKRFPRFFTYLGLFCFSMLGLVLGGTLLQLFIFWELVGLCSYLLIGFWYEKKSASNAAIKAFVTNRVGDFGFLIGFGILFYHLGNASLPDTWRLLGAAGLGGGITTPAFTISATMLTVMGIGLFFGAVGKSAQFPLHVWLPDAMEGPTPVSALIHAATMVAAGVYLVGRIFPILTPDAKLFIAIIGCTTLTMAALIALAQTDIKKVLAYSTLSQLGYMILAMGIGSWVGALFHLITHAFFKALLFLGSGSVIHAAHHEQELPQYGGLLKKIPITGITFGIAVLAIAGTPFFSGFYSKDMILAHAGAFGFSAAHLHKSGYYWLLFYLPAIIAYITPFYMTRCWMLTFWGKPRNQHLHDHAHEESILYGPLVILAVFAVIGGYSWFPVKSMIVDSIKESNALVKTEPFKTAWPADIETGSKPGIEAEASAEAPAHLTLSQEMHEEGEHLMHKTIGFAFLIGILSGVVVYWKGYWIAAPMMRIAPVRWINTWLVRRMYFDELYASVFVGITMALSRFSAWFDKYFVDGIVNGAAEVVRKVSVAVGLNDKYVVDGAVNGAAELAQGLGAAVRSPQNAGRVRMYVTVLMLAIGLGIAGAVIVILSR